MKKLFSLSAALLCTINLLALNNVPYIDASGNLQTANNVTEITNSTTTLTAGWYVVNGTDVQTAGLVCNGAVHLILADGATLRATGGSVIDNNDNYLTGYAGIRVSGEGNSLTIYGQSSQTGHLIAEGGGFAAGIGGSDREDGSHITINGGVIDATGDDGGGAGIGGGYAGDGSYITINGGVVTASGYTGAGIGGGQKGRNGQETGGYGSHIYINGGVVTASVTLEVGVRYDVRSSAIGHGYDLKSSSDIYIHDTLVVKADRIAPPATILSHTSNTDIASALSEIQFVVIYPVGPLTITFDKQDGTEQTTGLTATYGLTMPEISLPTRTGYTFQGYFTGENGQGTKYYNADGTSTRTCDMLENTTLYAHWTINRYTVTFDAQGGGYVALPMEVTYGSPMRESISVPIHTGYTFQGYFTETNGQGTLYYNANGTRAKETWDILSDMTLYAHWTINQYRIVFDQDGGVGGTTEVMVTYAADMPSITIPTQVGYTFHGYYTGVGSGVKYYNADGTSAHVWDQTDHYMYTLHAYWTANQYTITFDQQGGIGGIENMDIRFGEYLPEEIEVPTRTACVFGGYFTETNGQGTKYYNADGSIVSQELWKIPNNTTLYAYWIGNPYTVTFDQQGGTGGTESVIATGGAAMPEITLPTLSGYKFLGYFTEPDGAGTKYYNADGSSAREWDIANNNTTLYAFWAGLILYIDADGTTRYTEVDAVIMSTNQTTTLTTGWYVVRGEDVQTKNIVCEGDVHIILADGAKLTATADNYKAGIQVSSNGASLTIYGQTLQSGQLIANGGYCAAGIGGGNRSSGSNITINGGVITANGGQYADGIGNGYSTSTNSSSIYVADALYIRAGNTHSPQRGIAHASIADDIAASLAGKRYVTISNDPYLHDIPYILNGTQHDADNVTELTNETTQLSTGWYVVLGEDVQITNMTCVGDVKIIVADGTKLTITGTNGQSAIRESTGEATLTIYGQAAHSGLFYAHGDEGAACISVAHLYVPENSSNYVKADNSYPAFTIINTPGTDDLSELVASKRYMSISNQPYVNNIPFIDKYNTLRKVDDVHIISSETTTLSDGWYMIWNDTNTGSLTCQGQVNLILADGTTLTVRGTQGQPGIRVEEGATLTIYGQSAQTGQLIAYGGENGGAGIGGDPGYTGGHIVAVGGNIQATGGGNADAIGNDVGAITAYFIYVSSIFTEVKTGDDTESAEKISVWDDETNMAASFSGKHYVELKYYSYHDNVAYIDANGQQKHADNVMQISSGTTTLSSGWYVVTGEIEFQSGLTCQGDVHLILADDARLMVIAGITIDEEGENSLTIYGQANQTGQLIATGIDEYAAIGGNKVYAGANITILAGPSLSDLTQVEHTGGVDIASDLVGKHFVLINYNPYLTNVPYVDAKGVLQTVETAMKVTPGFDLTNGWYVVTGADEFATAIHCIGEVHLILADDAKLTVNGNMFTAGISVSGEGNSLTIYGQANQTGQLIATGGEYAAGIGGGDESSGSNITINGGVIIATGGDRGAGIGGGWGGSASNITINGGTITATGGGEDGAGIGGGKNGSASNITINGGSITATGGEEASGIGGGRFGDGSDIYVAAALYVRADNTYPPMTMIDHESIEHDMAGELAGKRYVLISNSLYMQHVPYLDADNTLQYADDVKLITSDTTTLTTGWYMVRGNVQTGNLTCSGIVQIIVADGSMLTATGANGQSAISALGEGSTLTIYGQSELSGVLVATGDGVRGISVNHNAVRFEETIQGNTVTITKNPRLNHVPYYFPMAGSISYADDVRVITSATTTLTAGWYLVTGNVETGSLTCVGDDEGGIVIILADGATLTVTGANNQAGIRVVDGTALTILGQKELTGTLIATGGSGAAGIGGGTRETGANIMLAGGNIVATGGVGADGIGNGAGATDAAHDIYIVPVFSAVMAGNDLNNMESISLQEILSFMIDISSHLANKQYARLKCLQYVYDVPYIDEDGKSSVIEQAISITSETTTLTEGWYVVQGDVTVHNLTCVGWVNVILADGATLTATGDAGHPGIHVNIDMENMETENYAVLVTLGQQEQSGKLIATGGERAAGIGGGENEMTSMIAIAGGTIVATGGNGAAGIGAGYNGQYYVIQIIDGTVTATGGAGAPAIGGNTIGEDYIAGIRVSDYLTVLADNSSEPTTIIAHDYNTNFAESLADKQYAKLIPGYLRYTTSGNYGTICLPYNVPDLSNVGAVFYQVAGVTKDNDVINGVVLEKVNELNAGYSYVYQASGERIQLGYGNERTFSPVAANGMVGKLTLAAETFEGGDDIYALGSDNLLHHVPSGIEINFVQHKAYFDLTDVPEYIAPTAAPGRVTMSIYGQQNTPTGMIDYNSNAPARKVMNRGQLYIINNGRIHNTQGMIIK